MRTIKLTEGYNCISVDGTAAIYVINGEVIVSTSDPLIQYTASEMAIYTPLESTEEDKYTFLGTYRTKNANYLDRKKYDLYYFKNSTDETLIAKWGDEPHQYHSGIVDYIDHIEQLVEAKKRAIAVGLLKE